VAASLHPVIGSVQDHEVANSISGALVHVVHKLPGLGRGEMDVIGHAVTTGDVYREPAGAGAEGGLALGKRAEGI
jgi:hypothetical protein